MTAKSILKCVRQSHNLLRPKADYCCRKIALQWTLFMLFRPHHKSQAYPFSASGTLLLVMKKSNLWGKSEREIPYRIAKSAIDFFNSICLSNRDNPPPPSVISLSQSPWPCPRLSHTMVRTMSRRKLRTHFGSPQPYCYQKSKPLPRQEVVRTRHYQSCSPTAWTIRTIPEIGQDGGSGI